MEIRGSISSESTISHSSDGYKGTASTNLTDKNKNAVQAILDGIYEAVSAEFKKQAERRKRWKEEEEKMKMEMEEMNEMEAADEVEVPM